MIPQFNKGTTSSSFKAIPTTYYSTNNNRLQSNISEASTCVGDARQLSSTVYSNYNYPDISYRGSSPYYPATINSSSVRSTSVGYTHNIPQQSSSSTSAAPPPVYPYYRRPVGGGPSSTMMSYTSTQLTQPGVQIATLNSSPNQAALSPSMRKITGNSTTTNRIIGGNVTSGTTMSGGIGSSSSTTTTTVGPSGYTEHTRTSYGGERILREEVVEHEIKVPKKVIVEETVEKVVVIPEKIVREEIVEETQIMRERIIEIAKPIIQEKIVEVPEYEYVDKIIEVPQTIVEEKIKEVPRVEFVEHLIYVPKIIQQEKIVEVPEIEYREYQVERIVEIPETRTEVKIIEKPIPQYVDVPVPQVVDVQVIEDIERQVPLPVEAVTTQEYRLPQFKSRYEKVPMPIYVPRFVEVAIPSEQMDANSAIAATQACQQVELAAMSGAPSLCELETLAERIKKFVPEMTGDLDIIKQRLAQRLPPGTAPGLGPAAPNGGQEYQDYMSQYINDKKKYSQPIHSNMVVMHQQQSIGSSSDAALRNNNMRAASQQQQ